MNLFKKRQSPKWARKLDVEQYDVLQSLIKKHSGGEIDLNAASKEGALEFNGGKLMLSNLVSACSHVEQTEWGDIVKTWLQAAKGRFKTSDLKYPEDVGSLKLQLYPSNYFSGMEDPDARYIFHEDIPGTITVVVIDSPNQVAALDLKSNSLFEGHRADVIAELRSQLTRLKSATISHLEIPNLEDGIFAAIEGSSILAATQVLKLDSLYPQLVGTHGALVSIPNRHLIICKRLNKKPAKEIVERLAALTQKFYKQSDYKLSDKMYLYHSGIFSEIEPA